MYTFFDCTTIHFQITRIFMFFMIPDVLSNATELIEDTNLPYCKELLKIMYEHLHLQTFV